MPEQETRFSWYDMQGKEHFPEDMTNRHLGHVLHFIMEGKLELNPKNDLDVAKDVLAKELVRRHATKPNWTRLTEPLRNDEREKQRLLMEQLFKKLDAKANEQCPAEGVPRPKRGKVR